MACLAQMHGVCETGLPGYHNSDSWNDLLEPNGINAINTPRIAMHLDLQALACLAVRAIISLMQGYMKHDVMQCN